MVKLHPPQTTYITIKRVSRVLGEAFLFISAMCLLALAYGTAPNRWYHVLSVYGGSMYPTFSPGDLIVITPPPAVLQPGMVLTMEVNGNLVTHRLVRVNDDGSLITKGDRNSTVDNWGTIPVRVVGQYRFAIPYLGRLVNLKNVFKTAFTGAWFVTSGSVDFSVESIQLSQQAGTSLAARLTAGGYFRDEGSIFGVFGEICLENPGSVMTENLTVSGQVEINNHDGLGFHPLVGGSFSVENLVPLGAGETKCFQFDYPFAAVSGSTYRLAMTAQITNHSGWLTGGPHCPGPDLCQFGPTVREGFEIQIPQIVPEATGEPTPNPETTPIPTPDGEETVEPTCPPSPEPDPTEELTQTPVPTDPTQETVSTPDPESIAATETITPTTPEP